MIAYPFFIFSLSAFIPHAAISAPSVYLFRHHITYYPPCYASLIGLVGSYHKRFLTFDERITPQSETHLYRQYHSNAHPTHIQRISTRWKIR